MPPDCVHHRLPRAGIDPIDHDEAAFLTVAASVTRPLRDETIVVLLDDARRGIAIVVVTGTSRADDVIEVVELLADPLARGGSVAAMVVASVRPTGAAPDHADVDRWLEMSDIAAQAGVDVLEWFVIGPEVSCPRDQLGEPPRW